MQSNKKTDVLLCNAETRAAVTIIRSLGRKDIDVITAGNHNHCPASYSRFSRQAFSYPSAKVGTDKIHRSLLKIVKKVQPDVLMPIFDDVLHVLYKYQSEYEKCSTLIPLVDKEVFYQLNNKRGIMDFSEKNKIPGPKSYEFFDSTALKKELPLIEKEIGYPMIIKPIIGQGSKGVIKVFDRKHLLEAFRKVKIQNTDDTFRNESIIIQEFLPNTLTYFNTLMHNGKLIAHQHVDIIRPYPSPCGAPACSTSFYDPELQKIGMEVLKATKMKNGALNIQFIFDDKDGKYKLLEINPRIWGSVQSSVATGVDFPYLMYQIAKGEKVKPIKNWESGKKVRHVMNEFRSCIQARDIKGLFGFYDVWKSSTEFEITDLKPNAVDMFNEFYTSISKMKWGGR